MWDVNFLEETLDVLREYGKSWDDVAWCGTTEVEIPKDVFEQLANKEYDNGYGSPKVATDLLVVGDNWYLERHEYDGSEWWEYKAIPARPERIVTPNAVVDDCCMWCSLKDMNYPDSWDWEGMERKDGDGNG